MREVLEGKNLERNLPPVLTKLATINGIFAELSFSMEYFRFCESVREGETELTEAAVVLFLSARRLIPDIARTGILPGSTA